MQATSPRNSKTIDWSTVVMFALGFWLSGSFIFDFLVVPGMLTTGMMNESGFASASYVIFGSFNHLEVLCAASVLAGCFVYRYGYGLKNKISNKSIAIATVLLTIALAYTYILTPLMSSAGMPLDMFVTEATSNSMAGMHVVYWSLEVIKLAAAAVLLRTFYRNSCSI